MDEDPFVVRVFGAKILFQSLHKHESRKCTRSFRGNNGCNSLNMTSMDRSYSPAAKAEWERASAVSSKSFWLL